MEKLSRIKLKNNLGIADIIINDGAVVSGMFSKFFMRPRFEAFDKIYWGTILWPQVELFRHSKFPYKLNYEKLIQNG